MKRAILLTFVLAFVFAGCSNNKIEENNNNDQYTAKLDKLPNPIGGLQALMKKINYPEEARKKGVEGKVILKVFIDENGNVVKANVLKGIDNGCDKEAVRAVKETKFTPGIKDGKAVKSYIIIPVLFELQD